ncbi:MAG TPA: 3-dehydroquinate synthase [Clostridiales bacterium]|nr:3-dehydroquinate synthase [Clostridiales bacterium]
MIENNNKLNIYVNNAPSYDLFIEADSSHLIDALGNLDMNNRRFMIITDSTVGDLYAKELQNILAAIGKSVSIFIFPAGEKSKNLDTVKDCYEQLILEGFDRKDVLIALGGGVVGDLTGFVASSFLRGIRFIQMPTSLLAMVDSSIGGKTGVDYNNYKNMVGAFYQPKLVYMNIAALQTLPMTEYLSGVSEIIKHGLIMDSDFYKWLKDNASDIKSRNYTVVSEMIKRSCQIKKEVVEEDPLEAGIRALLNFGHTIGHSVEKLKNFSYLHGECVALGACAGAYISYKRSYLSYEEYEDIIDTFKAFNQPVKVDGLDLNVIYETTLLDKKMDGVRINFILLKDIGKGIIDNTVTKDEMIEAIEVILE